MTRDASPPSGKRQIFHTGSGMVFLQLSVFTAGVLIARGLGPEGQGRFQLLISICVFTVMFAKLGMDEGVAYTIPRLQVRKPSSVRAVAVYALGVTSAVGVGAGLVVSFASGLLPDRLAELQADLRLSPWLVSALMVLMMALAILRGLGRSDLRAFVYYYGVGASFLIGIALFYIDGLTWLEAYVARLGSFGLGALAALVLIAFLLRDGRWIPESGEIKRLHAFAGWLVFIGLFQYMVRQPMVDLMIVGHFATLEAVGVYSVAAKVASLLGIIMAAFEIVLAPFFSRDSAGEVSEARNRRYRKMSTVMAHITTLAGGALWLGGTAALAIFGPEYSGGASLVQVLLIGWTLNGLLGINTPVLLASGFARLEFFLSAGAVVVMVVSGLALARPLGALGVAIATSGAVGLLAIGRHVACRIRVVPGRASWLPEVVVIGAVAGAAALALRQSLALGGIARSVVVVAVYVIVYAVLFLLRHRGLRIAA